MSVQAAMDFIAYMRESVQAASTDSRLDDLEKVVRLGAQMGYNFTADELRAAFRHDWQMRWLKVGTTPQG